MVAVHCHRGSGGVNPFPGNFSRAARFSGEPPRTRTPLLADRPARSDHSPRVPPYRPRATPRISTLAPRETRTVLLGVFFTFAPIGFLMHLVSATPGHWLAGVIAAVISGIIAIGWAYTFMSRRWWLLAPLILFQFAPWEIFRGLHALGLFDESTALSPGATRLFYAAASLLCIVLGYILVIRFTRSVERRGERLRAEVDAAARIHRALVPPIEFSRGGIQVYGRSQASSEMGGDLLDAVDENGRLGVYLADVSGHGVGAGVVMAMVKAAIRMRLREDSPIDSLLNDLNAVVGDVTSPEMFVTFACLRFRGSTMHRLVEIGLAGHLPILHYSAATKQVRDLPNDRLPLGIVPDETYIAQVEQCAPGDVFALYTDGITETMDASNRQFGIDRLRATLARLGQRPLHEIHAEMLREVASHGPQNDDRTLALIRVLA